MIRLTDVPLSAQTAVELMELQEIIDGYATYAEQVAEAKGLFARKNVKGNRTFDAVKSHLDSMCSGARRCGYCEDSCADEVEHIWPKNLYPNKAFLWSNYLYACGPCNGPKGDKWQIYRSLDGRRIDIGAKRIRLSLPLDGQPLLIDPRHDDPLDFMMLDLATFQFIPTGKRPSRSWQRAVYTIEVLHLNDRDPLVRSRKAAYISLRSILGDYIHRRNAGEAQQSIQALAKTIHDQPHITVWREMQRQSNLITELRALFTQAPEALDW